MDNNVVLEAFGFKEQTLNCIYDYAPVYKQEYKGQSCVLKRTRSPLTMAHELIRWTRLLSQKGVDVVTPIDSIEGNPRKIGEDVWVVYPFIEGHPYIGSSEQISLAGQLLGQIHSLTYPDSRLPMYDWEPIESGELQENIQLITQYSGQSVPVSRLVLEEYCGLLKLFSEAKLPHVISVWDYKANNLVFHSERVSLIDPDSAGQLPRIFDLAIALLLFHNDCQENTLWPARLFSVQEWQIFYRGYSRYISLNRVEKSFWPQAIQLMFVDEALWLLANDMEGWQHNPKQKSFLNSLLHMALEGYIL